MTSLPTTTIREAAEAGFPAPKGAARQLLAEAISALSSLDPEIRDGMAFALIEKYVGLGAVPVEDAAWLVDRLQSGGVLENGIGTVESDSVFGRSFAVLALGICLYRDNRENYLSREDWESIVANGERYAAAEVDLRGWVDGKGWAHAAAHTADLLGRLALSRYATPSTGDTILAALSAIIGNAREALRWGEDERLARAVTSALDSKVISPEQLLDWAGNEIDSMPALSFDPFAPQVFAKRQNLKQLLRAVYFRIDGDGELRTELGELQSKLVDV